MRKISRRIRSSSLCRWVESHTPVSYTHLDVYKRQGLQSVTDTDDLLRGEAPESTFTQLSMFPSFEEQVGTVAAAEASMKMCIRDRSVTGLKTVVTAIGAGVGVWGVINLLEGYGNDNHGAKSQGIKQLMSGGGIIKMCIRDRTYIFFCFIGKRTIFH